MADFRTPLPIHKAAFTRIAPGLAMPKDGLEDLRKAYQAADRSGDPSRYWRDVSDALARHVWRWPWLEACATRLDAEGIWPLDWMQERLPRPFDWHQTTHASRVQLLLQTLGAAVSTEKALAAFNENTKAGAIPGRLVLGSGDERCGASIDAEVRFRPQIERGDLSQLPPYFPGDRTWLRFKLDIPKRTR